MPAAFSFTAFLRQRTAVRYRLNRVAKPQRRHSSSTGARRENPSYSARARGDAKISVRDVSKRFPRGTSPRDPGSRAPPCRQKARPAGPAARNKTAPRFRLLFLSGQANTCSCSKTGPCPAPGCGCACAAAFRDPHRFSPPKTQNLPVALRRAALVPQAQRTVDALPAQEAAYRPDRFQIRIHGKPYAAALQSVERHAELVQHCGVGCQHSAALLQQGAVGGDTDTKPLLPCNIQDLSQFRMRQRFAHQMQIEEADMALQGLGRRGKFPPRSYAGAAAGFLGRRRSSDCTDW